MLKIIPYSAEWRERWEQFVWGSNNGTLFHTRRFLRYHPAHRFKDHSLLFLENEKILAVMPGAEKRTEDGRSLISHPGASFGGLVVPNTINLRAAFQLVNSLLDYCSFAGIEAIDLTASPIFYSEKINHYIDFALMKNGFAYRKREVSSFVTLDFAADAVLPNFKDEAGRAVRRAQKLGVQVRQSSDTAGFYEILKRNLKLRHNVQPAHSLKELNHLCELFPQSIRLYGAYLDDKLIAGVVMFNCNKLVTLAFYVSHDEAYQKYRAVNLLFFEIIRVSIEQRFRYLDFGIFTVDMQPNWGLARFKENFGSKGIFRDSFMKVL
jgi:hypothetical protein